LNGKTKVEANEWLPHLGRGSLRYRITTDQLPMDAQGFPDAALRQAIAHDAKKPLRRALYCWSRGDRLTLAALSFHVDPKPSIPLVITNIAVRGDGLRALSMFATSMLLDVLQDIAVKAPNRADHEIGALVPSGARNALLTDLGLRPCPRPPALQRPGTWYCYKWARPTP
jgi:hypothetical protein